MKRRKFNKNATLAALGLPLLSLQQIACKEQTKPNPIDSKSMPNKDVMEFINNIGIQLYSVRDLMGQDAAATLKAIKEMGYDQVELYDAGTQIEQWGAMCRDLDLKINCSHMNSGFVTQRWDIKRMPQPKAGPKALVETAAKAGLSHLTVAWLDEGERENMDQYRALVDQMNTFGALCKKSGITLSYHNHNFEFEPAEGTTPWDVLIEGFDPDLVQFELDVFWSSVAGVEPVALMKKMKNKIKLLHLKDKKKEQSLEYDVGKIPVEIFKELGNGVVDIQGVLAVAKDTGVAHCHVEQDHSPDILNSLNQSMNYLNT